MSTNRVTLGFIVVLEMACSLALGGFASPASAKQIVVTTLDDIAVSPFNSDSPCGTGTINDLPPSGLVLLREAIIAANNTPGVHTCPFIIREPGVITLLRTAASRRNGELLSWKSRGIPPHKAGGRRDACIPVPLLYPQQGRTQ